MKKSAYLILSLLLLILVLPAEAQRPFQTKPQGQGIGIRLGDPLGVTYKQYLSPGTALEFNLGTPVGGLYNRYYRNNRGNFNNENYRYSSHNIRYALALQGRYLFHEPFLPAEVVGLDWYYGFGAQLRIAGITEEYQRVTPGSPAFQYDDYTNFDLGPEIIIGAEYLIPQTPLAAFAEISLFMELLDNPFIFRLHSGLGVRYNF